MLPNNPDHLLKITRMIYFSSMSKKVTELSLTCGLTAVEITSWWYLLYLWILCLEHPFLAIILHIVTFPYLKVETSCSATQN